MKTVKLLVVTLCLLLISTTLSAQVKPTGTKISVISNTANEATVYYEWTNDIIAGASVAQTFGLDLVSMQGGNSGSITLSNPLIVDTITFYVTTNTGERVTLTFTENTPTSITIDFRNTIPLIDPIYALSY